MTTYLVLVIGGTRSKAMTFYVLENALEYKRLLEEKGEAVRLVTYPGGKKVEEG